MTETAENHNEAAQDQGNHLDRHRRRMTGIVVSTKMEKTAVVSVTRVFLHAKYRKYVRRRARYMAHDEAGACAVGDQVVIEECRPLSKHKRWVYKSTLRKKED
ncbi:MAG: 30S ribosomal protein S17 [Deltaproteobacteria bacterium]|nr:30S ribosomal protein S17 [Deltaproteobacteria bacterium]